MRWKNNGFIQFSRRQKSLDAIEAAAAQQAGSVNTLFLCAFTEISNNCITTQTPVKQRTLFGLQRLERAAGSRGVARSVHAGACPDRAGDPRQIQQRRTGVTRSVPVPGRGFGSVSARVLGDVSVKSYPYTPLPCP